MNLYLLEQDINRGYDTYDSCVVCAESEEVARTIHPSKDVTRAHNGEWYEGKYTRYNSDWVDVDQIDKIKVTYLGKADEQITHGVICSSFNAG